jgi:hypothetical protein
MRGFVKELLIFLIPASVLYSIFCLVLLPIVFSYTNGPSTKEQIHRSFSNSLSRDYSLLFLGNSRFYRGIDPDCFTIKAYNFSHDDDTYNQIYYKLNFLSDNGKMIKYLVLGVDYFQFSFISDARNHIYGSLLGEDYAKDYNSNYIIQEIKYRLGFLKPEKLQGLEFTEHKPFIKDNGQYIKFGLPKKNDSIKRSIQRLNIQVKYFEKILDLCNNKHIITFFVIMPIRDNEFANYKKNQICEFNDFLSSFTNESVMLLDFGKDKNFKFQDFSDITHLNADAAERFSFKLNDSIMSILNKR